MAHEETAAAASPSVSIIMPAYNRAAYIGRALRSLQEEAGIRADIIVVDDGSTDGTDEIVERLARQDSRVRLIRQPHVGVSAARNTGLRAARGDFITFLDSDDICAPGRIRRQIDKLMARDDIVAVVGERIYFTAITDDLQPEPDTLWERKLDVCLASGMFRRETFDRFGDFDERLAYGEDVDFYFRLFEEDSRFLIEVETAIYYRRHRGNMTNDTTAMFKSCLLAYHKSMKRRRAAGRTRRLDVFFFRKFDKETIFGGGESDAGVRVAIASR